MGLVVCKVLDRRATRAHSRGGARTHGVHRESQPPAVGCTTGGNVIDVGVVRVSDPEYRRLKKKKKNSKKSIKKSIIL